MKKLLATLALVFSAGLAVQAQNNVGINTIPDASAALDVVATDKGMLVPRVTTAQRNAIATPARGLMVYDSTVNNFYYHNGTAWNAVGGNGGPSLQLFATSTNAQTKPIYGFGRYTFNFNNVVSGASASSWINSNTFTVPASMGGVYNINSLLLLTTYSVTTPPVIAPEVEITRGATTTVYYGVGAASTLFQGSTTDNTAGPGTGPSSAPYSYSRGMVNLMIPLQAGDIVKVYFRFSSQSTSSAQTVSFSTDGSSYLSIVKMN